MLSATGLSATTTLVINATPAEDGSDFLSDAIADTATEYSVEFSDSDNDNYLYWYIARCHLIMMIAEKQLERSNSL